MAFNPEPAASDSHPGPKRGLSPRKEPGFTRLWLAEAGQRSGEESQQPGLARLWLAEAGHRSEEDSQQPGPARLWLAEDLGPEGVREWRGDVTTRALFSAGSRCRGTVTAGAECVVAGLEPALALLEKGGVEALPGGDGGLKEGEAVARGEVVLRVAGPARAVLALERLVLDLLSHLSGIATATAEVVELARMANPQVEVAATRKTTPGLRTLEKAAVVAGGGVAHRAGLYEAFLVKDNHLALLSGSPEARIGQAVRACREAQPGLLLEVEADTPAQALAAAKAGADWVLLDNFTLKKLAGTVVGLRAAYPGVLLEVSGGITPENVAAFAVWADRVSLGWLTQSAPAVPMSLHVEPHE